MAAKKRKRINRVVHILSKIYEIDYKMTQRVYHRFHRDIQVSKIELQRMYENQNELDHIDEVNLSF